MFKTWFAAALSWLGLGVVATLCVGLAILPARAAAPTSPVGYWVTASHDAVIEITPCGNALCGQIEGIVLEPTDPVPHAWAGQTQCGLTILQTAATPQDDSPAWYGHVTDPRNGSIYHARVSVDANGNLQLRGYLGLPLFGRTQTWTRYIGPTHTPDCRLSTVATQTAANEASPAG